MSDQQEHVDFYAYYLVDEGSVAHRVLTEAEDLARKVYDGLGKMHEFAKAKKMILGLGLVDDQMIPILIASTESQVDTSVSPLNRVKLESRMTTSWNPPENTFIPSPFTAPEALRDWQEATTNLCKIQSYRHIEEVITNRASNERVRVPTEPDTAQTFLSDGIALHAAAYKVFARWVYVSPINPKSKGHYIPPQSQKIGSATVDEMTLGLPLTAYRSDHKRIWTRLQEAKTFHLS